MIPIIENPARLKNPPATNWLAQPLPATSMAGDVSVTLQSFASGLGSSTTHKATGDGREAVVAAIFWMKVRAGWKETVVQEAEVNHRFVIRAPTPARARARTR